MGIVDCDGKDLQWLPIEVPKNGFYLGQVEWAGNSNEVLVETLSRFRDKREFWLVSVGGHVKTIFTESNEAWAVPSQNTNSGLTWIRDGKEFIVVSEKDGWRHAFLYSREGQERSLLTPGDYDIIERAIVDEEGGWYYFYASPNNGTQKYLYRVPLDGSGTLELITPKDQPGTHDYDFSPDAKWAFHTYSTLDSPPTVELIAMPEHRAVRVLEDNNELRAKMKKLISYPTEFFQLDIGDGVSMDAWTREVNPEGYERSAPINFADGLQGKLLMITGSGETNTHIQIIEGLVDRLIELGKPFDYMVYPNRDHGLSEGRGSEVHVQTLIIRYLIEHLPAGPS